MNNFFTQWFAIIGKEFADASRTRLLTVLSVFMLSAGLVALLVAAVALHEQQVDYQSAKELLLSLGKLPDQLIAPNFQPLLLLRGFIEYVEIIGAVLGIILGHRTITYEKGAGSLPILLTRPLGKLTLLSGKIIANLILISIVLMVMFTVGTLAITLVGTVSLSLDDLTRIAITLFSAIVYVGCFLLLGLLLALWIKRPAHAILVALSLWLTFILITPQIGDTLDPDNQVGAGVFRTLGIAKPQEKQIMLSFAHYETVRDSIEQSSPAKHFERWSFALLGIKSNYAGVPISQITKERSNDATWLVGFFFILLSLTFTLPLNIHNFTKE